MGGRRKRIGIREVERKEIEKEGVGKRQRKSKAEREMGGERGREKGERVERGIERKV